MDDLISRAAAIAWFFRPYSNEESYSNLDVERALKAIPAVDAAPVVRCKDCKYRGEDECPMRHVESYYHTGWEEWDEIIDDHTTDNSFCDRPLRNAVKE